MAELFRQPRQLGRVAPGLVALAQLAITGFELRDLGSLLSQSGGGGIAAVFPGQFGESVERGRVGGSGVKKALERAAFGRAIAVKGGEPCLQPVRWGEVLRAGGRCASASCPSRGRWAAIAQSNRASQTENIVGSAEQAGVEQRRGLIESTGANRQIGLRQPDAIIVGRQSRGQIELGAGREGGDGVLTQADVFPHEQIGFLASPFASPVEGFPPRLERPQDLIEAAFFEIEGRAVRRPVRARRSEGRF